MDNNKPERLKVRYHSESAEKMNLMLSELSLNTVCKEAFCPNINECFQKKTATFMIMGKNCTRHCRYCAVSKGVILPLDPEEPENVAVAAKTLGLKHIVITSVTRDDLEDGGALHFAKTVQAVKSAMPGSTVEILIPDMGGKKQNLDRIIASEPDVINHNIETVPSLYAEVRPEANYHTSLSVLKYVKDVAPEVISKTGIMVGLGEKKEEVLSVMDDLVEIDCDIFTIGQYLRPSGKHIKVEEYISPEMFAEYKKFGEQKGIRYVASGRLVRSSYKALEAINKIRENVSSI